MSKQLDFAEELKEHLPGYYEGVTEFEELIRVESSQLMGLDDLMESVVDQTFIDTASWAIGRLEFLFGIPSNTSKPLDQKRSFLKAKRRGAGVTTVAMIKEVVESWYNGEVEVTEKSGGLTIQFNSDYGTPSNLKDVEKALREILPAHLMIQYLFTYLLINEIHNTKTLAQMETITLDQFAGGA